MPWMFTMLFLSRIFLESSIKNVLDIGFQRTFSRERMGYVVVGGCRGCLPCNSCQPALEWIAPLCNFAQLHVPLFQKKRQITNTKEMTKTRENHAKCLPCNICIFIFSSCSFFYALEMYQILFFVKARELYVFSNSKVDLISYELERSHRRFRCQFYRL